jgi:hypothetical protein
MKATHLTRVAVAAGATALIAVPTASAIVLRAPVAKYKIANPGVIWDGRQYVVLSTGAWDSPRTISVAPEAGGPYRRVRHPLLSSRPNWSAVRDRSVWAPSETKIGNTYVVFYATVIKGSKSAQRCIGTGVSRSSTGPFVPRPSPISCVGGHGAPDSEPGVPPDSSSIDPTPAWVTIKGQRRLYLTYKTDGPGYTTIRMVRLRIPGRARGVWGASHTLTVAPHATEENPVLVQRGKVFTLFTSVGSYLTCRYHTYWRQSTHLWRWPQARHLLASPANAETCADGDAQVYPGLPPHSWRIWFSGHYGSSIYDLYTGTVIWPHGVPEVLSLL